MSYQIEWLLPRRVIAVRVTGQLTLSEIEAGSRDVIALLDAGTAPVHIVIDISSMTSYPLRVSTLADSSTYLRHPRLGWLVIYSITSFMLASVISILSKVARVRSRVVSSRDEAVHFLAAQDLSLAGLLDAERESAQRAE